MRAIDRSKSDPVVLNLYVEASAAQTLVMRILMHLRGVFHLARKKGLRTPQQ